MYIVYNYNNIQNITRLCRDMAQTPQAAVAYVKAIGGTNIRVYDESGWTVYTERQGWMR